jgi:hypothetical protein
MISGRLRAQAASVPAPLRHQAEVAGAWGVVDQCGRLRLEFSGHRSGTVGELVAQSTH